MRGEADSRICLVNLPFSKWMLDDEHLRTYFVPGKIIDKSFINLSRRCCHDWKIYFVYQQLTFIMKSISIEIYFLFNDLFCNQRHLRKIKKVLSTTIKPFVRRIEQILRRIVTEIHRIQSLLTSNIYQHSIFFDGHSLPRVGH